MRRMIKYLKEWNKWRKRNANGIFYKFLALLKLAKSPTFEIMKRDEIYINMWGRYFLTDNNKFNLITCRYNQLGKCTNDYKRKECVEVSRKVLCLEDRENVSCKQRR